MVGRKLTGAFFFATIQAFLNQLSNHADESRMRARRASSMHSDPVFLTRMFCGIIKIV
jgi:hypothetical protein